jgi:5-methylcytosine-specific restriction endonuclease McrA
MECTLILNATYEPIQVVTWKRAVRMLFQGKVEVIAEYENEVRSASLAVRIPSVLRLLHYVQLRRQHLQVKFTRANLYARDNYKCQYCGQRRSALELTYDHVIPVARGGGKSWENIVTCCRACNLKKGDRLPEEAGLRLLRPPLAPGGFPHKFRFLGRSVMPDSWRHYIFWQVEASMTQG